MRTATVTQRTMVLALAGALTTSIACVRTSEEGGVAVMPESGLAAQSGTNWGGGGGIWAGGGSQWGGGGGLFAGGGGLFAGGGGLWLGGGGLWGEGMNPPLA